MRQMHVFASATIPAPAAQVYAIIADYHNGHPRILPTQYFRDLTVETGGIGAGTVINFKAGMPGMMQPIRATVTEPEPGRVLVETNESRPPVFVSTFTVDAMPDSDSCRVTITSAWQLASGAQGMIERMSIPPLLRRMYRAELRQLSEMAAR